MPAEKSKIPYVCDVPGCPTPGRTFYRPSEYKKHKDRHLRPYKCEYPNCTAPSFGDAGGLFRHKREVHRRGNSTSDADNSKDPGIADFRCPEPSCQRSQKGFPRRWNLMEHQKRVHHVVVAERGEIKRGKRALSLVSPTTTASSMAASSPSTAAPTTAALSPGAVRNLGRSDDLSSFSLPPNVNDKMAHDLNATLKKLQRKKDELEEAASKVNHDINVIRQAIDVAVQVGGE